MNPVTYRLGPVLYLALLLTACGDATLDGPTAVSVPGVPWAEVTQEQVDAATAMGVPVARTAGRHRFVYIPAGTFQRHVDGADYDVNLGVGFYIETDRSPARSRDDAVSAAAQLSRRDETWSYRLSTEAEWEYAQRFLPAQPPGPESMLDRFGPLPTWTVSDPHGPREGDTYVVRDGDEREGLPADKERDGLGFRLVSPLGYGLGKYGATQVTFRLVDEFAPRDAKPLPGGYDLRVISMNDRLQARTMGEEREWTLVPDPGSPVTLTMVPGAYYVYAERTGKDGAVLRGKEMKFYVKDVPVERSVPIPERDQKRYGSGGREKPQ